MRRPISHLCFAAFNSKSIQCMLRSPFDVPSSIILSANVSQLVLHPLISIFKQSILHQHASGHHCCCPFSQCLLGPISTYNSNLNIIIVYLHRMNILVRLVSDNRYILQFVGIESTNGCKLPQKYKTHVNFLLQIILTCNF